MNGTTQLEFERHYGDWRALIETEPELRFSSLTHDAVDTEPYRQIVALGEAALAFAIDKLRDGDFYLNNAVLEIAGISLSDVVADPEETYSAQEISAFILDWWAQRQPAP